MEFRKGFGTKEEEEAQHEVASALGLSSDTLSTWRKRLRDELEDRADLDWVRDQGERLHELWR